MYIPPHAEIWGWADSQNLVRDLRARFQLSAIEEMLGDDFDRHKWLEPVLLVYDERVRTIAELIWGECHSDLDSSSLYGESLTTALMAGFFTRARTTRGPNHAGLSRLTLKLTLEYMEANLVREIHLNEVARVAGLSCSHFGRAFKASMGASPHRWLLQRRIERAQQLLAKKETIASTAQIVGFATQSHFGKAFRTITGTSPREWMRDSSLL
jgi:AraC family transcriptional regulator